MFLALGKELAVVRRFWVSLGLLVFMGVSFTVATMPVSPAYAAACFSIFTNKTTADGLGNNGVNGVYADGSNVYTATDGGLSISADCVSSSPPLTGGGAPAPVKPPTLADTGSDLSLVLAGSGN